MEMIIGHTNRTCYFVESIPALDSTCGAEETRSISRQTGFGYSMVELVVTLTIVLILAAIAIPNFVRAMNSYSLGSAVQNVSLIIQRTRYEAIKRNTNVSCYYSIDPNGNVPIVWVDINGTGVRVPTDPQFAYTRSLLNANPGPQIPGPASMGFAAVVQPAAITAGGGILVTFDSRGAVSFGGAPPVWAMYYSLNNNLSYGVKAITIEPFGRSKVWSALPNDNAWHSP
jgi:type II secretory pathway pseudopilin PulG